MIKSVRIKNFQSHKDSFFEFHPNVNIISGSTNNGKSVVIRALNWAIKNKAPSSFCSDWNLDKKGNQIENVEVEVTTEKGNCSRVKGKKNGYVLNGSEYNAIGRDIPEQVKEFFNLTDTNIQSQMDSPFLLSLNGPDATKFINKVVKLDCIDTILSKAEKERRSIGSELKVVENDIKHCENEISKLEWVEKAESFQKRIDSFEDQIKEIQEEFDSLDSNILLYKQKKSEIVDIDFSLVDEIDKELNELNELEGQYNLLSEEINSYKKVEIFDFTNIDNLLNKIETLESGIDETEINELENNLRDFRFYISSIDNLNSEISELEKQLPEVCPFCGSKIEGDVCEI